MREARPGSRSRTKALWLVAATSMAATLLVPSVFRPADPATSPGGDVAVATAAPAPTATTTRP